MQPNEACPAPAEHDASECAPGPPRMSVLGLLYLVIQVALFDVFLYQGSAGLGYAVLFVATGLLILGTSAPRFSPRLGLFVGVLALVAGRSAWQSDGATLAVGFAALFALASCAVGNSTQVPELLASCLGSVRGLPRVAASAVRLALDLVGRTRLGRATCLPIVVPLGVGLAFLGLFGLANTILASWLQAAWSELSAALSQAFALLDSPGRVVVWIGFALIAALLAFPKRVVAERLERLRASEPLEAQDAASDVLARTARNTLLGVNLLFFAYNAVDVVYLWVRHALPAGTSYSDYAREGVFWLTAALALTSLVLGIIFSGPLNAGRRSRPLEVLALVWVAQNLFLALAAYQRLYIYFSFNGLTEMRIVGALGIALVVAGLLIVTLKLRRRRTLLWMLRQQLSVLALFALGLFLLPSGALVSHVNARRILTATSLQEVAPAVIISHHAPSPEGLAALVPLLYLDNPHLSAAMNQALREGVASVLLRERSRLRSERRLHPGWPHRELAIERALNAIEHERERLRELVPDGRSAEATRRFQELTQPWW
jgi:hypothetical protein